MSNSGFLTFELFGVEGLDLLTCRPGVVSLELPPEPATLEFLPTLRLEQSLLETQFLEQPTRVLAGLFRRNPDALLTGPQPVDQLRHLLHLGHRLSPGVLLLSGRKGPGNPGGVVRILYILGPLRHQGAFVDELVGVLVLLDLLLGSLVDVGQLLHRLSGPEDRRRGARRRVLQVADVLVDVMEETRPGVRPEEPRGALGPPRDPRVPEPGGLQAEDHIFLLNQFTLGLGPSLLVGLDRLLGLPVRVHLGRVPPLHGAQGVRADPPLLTLHRVDVHVQVPRNVRLHYGALVVLVHVVGRLLARKLAPQVELLVQ